MNSSTTTSFLTSSDYRLKENVTPISSAVERLNALKPVRFNFKADTETTVDGFLAHEVQEVVPEAVS
ncbi:tail fiber domain-containing protein [bacterium]|nr:tail fiber domain-containing protein [bacterium]